MNTRSDLDYLIIGAGPAGLQLGYYLERSSKNYMILESGDSPATFFATFPRHRRLISTNKVYTACEDPETNLRWDWNSLLSDSEEMLLKHYSKCYFPDAADIQRYLTDFARHFEIKVTYGTRVTKISKEGRFTILDQLGNAYTCQRLIVATGVTKPYIPSIPGVELGESYFDFSIAPKDFVNQRVLIIGKGNSAFETADNLIETASTIHLCSPNPVTMAWKSHFVGHLRALNNNFLDTYQLKSQNGVLDANIETIERRDGEFVVNIIYNHAKGEHREICYDRVLVCTGFRFDDSIFEGNCKPELTLNDRFPQQTSEWESPNVKDLYFAGILMQVRDYKKTMSAFIHGFRYNVRALSQILACKYDEEDWPSQTIPCVPQDIADAIINRINTSSALFQQPGFFCDLLVMSHLRQPIHYYKDIPVDYLHDSAFGKHDHYYTISLEYGDFHSIIDPFNVERDPDPARAELTVYLHPIIRRFSGHSLVHEHHIPEDLENVYAADKYTQPLVNYLCKEIYDLQAID